MYKLMKEFVGSTPYLFNEQFVVKGAQTGANFAWHQDGAYVGFDHKPYVTMWIALDDTTRANGCIYFLPRNLDLDERVTPHRWDPSGKEMVGYDGPDRGVAIEVSAGSVALFSSTTLHSSGENSTAKPRRAYICQYSPEPIIDPSSGHPKHFAKPLVG
jgi:ectoine hydroxylase-related dioxygenase (phytanoyl-CoA dioxygenase family)